MNSDAELERFRFKFPKFTKISLDVSKLDEPTLKDIALIKEETGDNIRLVITGDRSKLKTVDQNNIRELGLSVQLKSNEITENMEEAVLGELTKHTSSSLQEEFKKYCVLNKVKKVDSDRVVPYIKKIEEKENA